MTWLEALCETDDEHSGRLSSTDDDLTFFLVDRLSRIPIVRQR